MMGNFFASYTEFMLFGEKPNVIISLLYRCYIKLVLTLDLVCKNNQIKVVLIKQSFWCNNRYFSNLRDRRPLKNEYFVFLHI